MTRPVIYAFFIMMMAAPALAQQLSTRSPGELRQLLQESKLDSNRILILHALGRTYLDQVYSNKKQHSMDTAIEIFNHAVRLSDTLQLKHLRYESMELEGQAYLTRGNSVEGKKRFFELAAIYHLKGDIGREARAWCLLALRMNHERENQPDIEAFFDKAITLYKQAHNIKGEAEVRAYLADYLFQSNMPSKAENELLLALDLLHQVRATNVSRVYYLLSVVNRYRGSYEKSLLYATECVENAERYQDLAPIDIPYGELALVYDELGRAEESCQWYRKTLNERLAQKDDRVIVFRTAGFLIRQLIKLKKSRNALALMDSLATATPPQGQFEKAIVAQNFACCFDALKQYAEAERYFLAMTASLRDAPWDQELISIGNMDAGRFYLQRGQFKKAHVYLDTALAYSRDARLLDQRALLQMLFTADSALGNYSTAIKYLQRCQFINDSIYNERKSRQIEELTIQYETQKKEQNIRLLEKERRLQQNELIKEQNTKRWIVGVTLLLVVITGLLVNYSRLKQRTNRKLRIQQRQIEKKNDSLQHLVEEKEWLVKEIHHRVKNNFQIVMALLRTQAAYLQGSEAIQAVTESQQRIQAMSLVHQKLYQSDNLSAINMADYIHELIDCLKDSFHTGYTIRFNLQIEPVKLDVSHCVPLGLILNEAVTNAIKHAFPGKKEGVIHISLKSISHNHFLLSIKDNGTGLPATFDSARQTSMGMKLMRGLSGDLDATFQVNNNGGTEILLDFASEA
ncbi:tetratricopeptide repeat-containing sensor histidine kinase [Chitinophaga filiformis]|uniref:histidine kinase n=1 Tax=Chitinophaga filiformis TaxID=104663 RepID=A0A1G7Z8P5_CHIFI|nr:sensor histidine kinase [Chitinophaga filiformis]SDH04979.1 Two-component sensor histidine kinase, contains HisKA and HATPase domains [Chitinophaga filiformis]